MTCVAKKTTFPFHARPRAGYQVGIHRCHRAPEGDHGVWDETWANEELYAWFQQHRRAA